MPCRAALTRAGRSVLCGCGDHVEANACVEAFMWAIAPLEAKAHDLRHPRVDHALSQAGFDGALVPWFRPRGRRAFRYAKSEEVFTGVDRAGRPPGP